MRRKAATILGIAPRTTLVGVAAATAMAVGGPVSAQSLLDPAPNNVPDGLVESGEAGTYVIQLRDDPGVRYQGGLSGYAATAPQNGAAYDKTAPHVKRYTDYLTSSHDQALADVGADGQKIYSYCHALNGFAARLTAEQANRIRRRQNVAAVWKDHAVDVETNNSPRFLGLLNRKQGLRKAFGFKGEDVIVGILDTGAVQEHPSFSDRKPRRLPKKCKNPKSSYVQAYCDKLRKRPGKLVYDAPPKRWQGVCQAGEAWSEEDCNNKLIGARWFVDGFLAGRGSVVEGEFLSPRDSSGHGSHTAGTAAGNEVEASLQGTPLTTISGMAPRARLAVYKVCWLSPGATNFSCFFSDSAAATDAAVADGVDVLNFSVGTAAAFDDPQDLAFLDASAAGVFIARSAGNSGPAPQTTNAGEPWVTSVAASTLNGQAFALSATVQSPPSVAGDYPALEGSITQPLTESGGMTGELGPADPIDACAPLTNSLVGRIAFIARGACAFTTKIENAVGAGATGVLMYSDNRPKTIMGGTATSTTTSIPGVMIDNAPGLAILAELQADNEVNITVEAGAFTTEPLDGNIMADFSSRGPFVTEADWIKPDITAPGVRILAPSTPEPSDGSAGDLFAYLQGTSMSSPHIAGLGALIIEAFPEWTPAQVKSALMTTARRNIVKEDGTTPADPFDFGAGHARPNRTFYTGLTYNAELLDYLAASCGTVTPLISADNCGFVQDVLGLSTDPADLNLPSIGVSQLAGTKTIRRTVTAVREIYDPPVGSKYAPQHVYRARVRAPEGYKVKVNPKQLKLRAGETASFDVTISNVSAPPGEWRFGSLTWRDTHRRYTVRSPIAVNAVAVAAPSEVSGTGADGSADFDVTFGYSGDYTAQVHGLNDARLILTNVEDDPGDSFQFLGPGTAIAFLEELPEGTAFARWSTFNEYTSGDDDVDLYLYYCPEFSCTQIASSGNTDGNEGVSVTLPANDPTIEDPYLVFVHGFDTEGGAPADVVLFSWTVGIDNDAGNMTVSAPSQATVGETATLGVEWNGLSVGPGSKQLGAISHSDANGIQGLTLINVTNDAGGALCDLQDNCP